MRFFKINDRIKMSLSNGQAMRSLIRLVRRIAAFNAVILVGQG
jgi:hypothetical protein